MADVFLSYSRDDEAFVLGLATSLQERGKEVWRDRQDIPPATAWRDEIAQGVDASDLFAFVITPSSLKSPHCAEELAHAVERGKRILPILRREGGPPVPSVLAQRNFLFLRERDDQDAGIASLVAAIDGLPQWTRAHTELLRRAREWEAQSRPRSSLLRGGELRDAEDWLSRGSPDREPQPVETQREFIHASRQMARRLRRAGTTVSSSSSRL